MLKRRWSVILAVIFLVFAFFLKNYLGGLKQDPPRAGQSGQNKNVAVIVVANEDVKVPLKIAGRLRALSRAEIYSEVSGVMLPSGKEFRAGNSFSTGETLLRIDDSEARLALTSAKSALLNSLVQIMADLKIDYPESYTKWKAYLDAYDINKTLAPMPTHADSKEKYFLASRNISGQFYNIQSQETRLAKYAIKAPFNGVLSDVLVNQGTLIRQNQKLGDFVSTGQYELEASITAVDLELLKPGATVQFKSGEIAGSWTGVVKRVNEVLDASTQTVKVYIAVNGANLKEGMFLSGMIDTKPIPSAMVVSRNLLLEDNKLFCVNDSVLESKSIQVIRFTENKMVISGLENGQLILAEPLAGAREGMIVKAIR